MNKGERISTDHYACNAIVDILLANGVSKVIVSPGSRNAPMIVALSRCDAIKKYVVVDERSAAFMAVGMCQQANEPVAIVCTSGTAVLNYAPAVAEAFYQRLPLIVISADRPEEWIDQNDSQTIVQNGVLSPIVKGTFNIPARFEVNIEKWYANRLVNEAVMLSKNLPNGPVHINLQLQEPLCGTDKYLSDTRVVEDVQVEHRLSDETANKLSSEISRHKKVMVLATMTNGNTDVLNNALIEFSRRNNVIVLTETISNLKCVDYIPTIDRTLSAMQKEDRADYAPDLLISFGGAPITRMLKQYLRQYENMEQWYIDDNPKVVDTMQHLTKKIKVSPEELFKAINQCANKDIPSNYKQMWLELKKRSTLSHHKFVDDVPWSDLKAFSVILPSIPADCNLQLSNGTSIRYVQLFDVPEIRRSNCNRGVAGIDGATSTALGASLAKAENTILITGDMSLSYDLNGMSSQYNNQHFKIIVICNGGGGIFRFIKGPSDLDELEDYFEVHREIPVEGYASTFGFDYFKAENEAQLIDKLPKFYNNDKASILAVYTPRKSNAKILREYFKRDR